MGPKKITGGVSVSNQPRGTRGFSIPHMATISRDLRPLDVPGHALPLVRHGYWASQPLTSLQGSHLRGLGTPTCTKLPVPSVSRDGGAMRDHAAGVIRCRQMLPLDPSLHVLMRPQSLWVVRCKVPIVLLRLAKRVRPKAEGRVVGSLEGTPPYGLRLHAWHIPAVSWDRMQPRLPTQVDRRRLGRPGPWRLSPLGPVGWKCRLASGWPEVPGSLRRSGSRARWRSPQAPPRTAGRGAVGSWSSALRNAPTTRRRATG